MLRSLFLAANLLAVVTADCLNPGPAFQNPGLKLSNPAVQGLPAELSTALNDGLKLAYAGGTVFAPKGFSVNETSFSIELTSATETLWTSHHTAAVTEEPVTVDGNSVFRIASVTKVFAVATVLMQEGMCLDDPITKYIPELKKGGKKETVQWSKITLRDLAAQTSGIFRNYPAGDLSFYPKMEPGMLQMMGLPELTAEEMKFPGCSSDVDVFGGCKYTRKQLLSQLMTRTPVYNPGFAPSYSNTAYTLLGLAVAAHTKREWNPYIQKSIFDRIGMKNTFTSTPKNANVVIPVVAEGSTHTWYDDLGIDVPAGGLYSTSSDLSRFARTLLNAENLPKHKRIMEPEVVNRWLQPTSFVPSTGNAQGMPWEIRRLKSEKLTRDGRPIDLYTKNGGLPGYTSVLVFIPEYQVALSILTAGSTDAFRVVEEIVVPNVVKSLEKIFRSHSKDIVAGTYHDENTNSTVTLELDDGSGLKVTKFLSKGMDMITTLPKLAQAPPGIEMRATPTGVKTCDGERFRIKLLLTEQPKGTFMGREQHCLADLGAPTYGGEALLEFVKKENSLYLPAFKVELVKQ